MLTGNYSIPLRDQIKYYLLFDIVALGVVLTSFIGPLISLFNKHYLENPYLAIYQYIRFWPSFLYMSTISAEIGAVVDSSHALSQHPVLGIVGKPLYRAVEALEIKALGWGHDVINVVEKQAGISFSQELHNTLGGKEKVEMWLFRLLIGVLMG